MFSGGYVGVDVFFVISGYLITTIIVREIESNEFSLIKFYERRIRRIYPALYTVIAFVLIVAFFLYDPQNFMLVGKSVIAATLFVSNMLFWSEAGYFDAPSTLKPLLHTWSLAVEEQFYIVFPLLVFLIMRFARKRLKLALGTIAVASFLFSLYYVQRDTSAAFYFAPLRTWELLIGALLAISATTDIHPKLRNAMSLAGIVMILASVFLYDHETLFPGISALLPTLGAALVIYAGIKGNTFVGNLLSLPPVVFIGKISYSLYLWHWPIIIFGRYYVIRPATGMEVLLWVIAAFLLSILSWHFVENPFRSKTFLARPRIFIFGGTIMALTLMVAGTVYWNDGMPKRFENEKYKLLSTASKQSRKWKDCNNDNFGSLDELTVCAIGADTIEPIFLLWGDSHARVLAESVELPAQKGNLAGELITLNACPPLLGVDRADQKYCREYNDKVIEYIQAHPELDTVILAGRWALAAEGNRYGNEDGADVVLIDQLTAIPSGENLEIFKAGLDRTVEKLLELNRKVVIVLPIPEVGYDVPSSYFIALRTGRDINEIIAPTLGEYMQRNRPVIAVMDDLKNRYSVQLIDPATVMCDKRICKVVVDGRSLYLDGHHLSTFGSEYVSSIFDTLFGEMSLSPTRH